MRKEQVKTSLASHLAKKLYFYYCLFQLLLRLRSLSISPFSLRTDSWWWESGSLSKRGWTVAWLGKLDGWRLVGWLEGDCWRGWLAGELVGKGPGVSDAVEKMEWCKTSWCAGNTENDRIDICRRHFASANTSVDASKKSNQHWN